MIQGLAGVLLLASVPAVLGLLLTPLAAHLLAPRVRRARWIAGVLGWTVISTLAFALWFRHGVDAEVAARTMGEFRQYGTMLVLGFAFWNGIAILGVNAAGAVAGAVLRRRRAAA